MNVWVLYVYKWGGMLGQGIYSTEELAIEASKKLPIEYTFGIVNMIVDGELVF
jgi:hypothetical protein